MASIPLKAGPTTTVSTVETSAQQVLNEGPDIFVAAQYGDWQRIEQLIKHGTAKATDVNEQNITPLHWAAINDRLLACKALLDNGAQVNATGGDLNATPMMWAAKNGHSYIVHLLVTYGGDPALVDSQGYNVLQLATHSSNVMLILYLLHIDVPVDSVDPQGHTCLMWAAYQGDALSVESLLHWGANVNARDADGLNALHWAVVRGNRGCVRRILEEGADLAAKQNEGKTARELSVELKTKKVFESALESVGRDPETGLLVHHWLSNELSLRLVFLLPYLFIGPVIKLFAIAPIMISLPINAVVLFGCQKLGSSVLVPPSLRTSGIHKTPYLAGIFSGSAFWTTVHYLAVLIPTVGYSSLVLTMVFGLIFTTCMYNFFVAMLADPGFIPNNGGRTDHRESIEELLRAGEYDNLHFCITCCLRKPLRSKHCKICNRCVAKHDHHCPWVNNCVALRNHRNFMVYVLAMLVGIPMYAILVVRHLQQIGPVKDPVECTVLSDTYCAWFQSDGFGILMATWDCLQLTWISMLAVVQLAQISRAVTTQEVINLRHYGFMGGGGVGTGSSRRVPVADQVTSLIAAGTSDPDAAALGPDGQGPPPPPDTAPECGHEHHTHSGRRAGSGAGGAMQRLTRLFGIDQFIDTAREGIASSTTTSRQRSSRASRNKTNPFSNGLLSNCGDFWGSAPSEIQSHGAGRVKRTPVDFYRLYTVPETSTELYSRLPTEEV